MKPRDVGGAVVINGKLNMRVETAGKPDAFQAVYTDVYAKRDGRWRAGVLAIRRDCHDALRAVTADLRVQRRRRSVGRRGRIRSSCSR